MKLNEGISTVQRDSKPSNRRIGFGIFLAFLFAFSLPLHAQMNPVPLVNQPLVPTAAIPGGPGFVLTVNGTGFTLGSVVNWNGATRVTTFVSNSQLKAAISASDIIMAATASVTVSNPGPGGGVSKTRFFQVISPAASIALSRSDFAAGTAVTDTIAADFNGDNKLDLAFVHGGGTTLSVSLGNGDGTFKAPVTYTTGNDSVHLATADFNGDGKLDLVTTDGADNTVSILLGNGDGTFQARSAYPTGTFPIAVATGDFNGDGKLDLAITDASANAVSILLGKGDGTFQPPVTYGTGQDPQAAFIGDFNADGKLDLAIGNLETNSVSILLGNGNGTFQSHVDYPVAAFAQSVVGADLNGDGKLDLVVASFNASTVSVLLGNGNGTFQSHVDYTTAGTTGAVAVGDLNGDGKLDLVTSNGNNGSFNSPGSVSTFLGNGDGTFQSRHDFTTGGTEAVVIGDFNGDGRLDMAIDNLPDNTFSVLLQSALGGGTGTDFSLSAATGINCPNSGNCSVSAAVRAPGQTATYNLQVVPVSGFNGIVTLTCGDALAKSGCSVSPASVAVSGTTATAFTVTVTSSGSMLPPYSTPVSTNAPFGSVLFALALIIACLTVLRQRRSRLVPVIALLIMSVAWMSSCGTSSSGGGGGGNAGTRSGTVTITGTSSGVNHSLALNLTVN